MPNLSSQFKHEEPKLYSSLQIRPRRKEEKKVKKNTTAGKLLLRALCILRTVPPVACSPAFHALVVFATIFGFSPFYPCCNNLYLDCMVFHLVCKAI